MAYYRWRTHSDLNQLSLAQLDGPLVAASTLRPQLDALVHQTCATQPDPRIRVFRQEDLHNRTMAQ